MPVVLVGRPDDAFRLHPRQKRAGMVVAIMQRRMSPAGLPTRCRITSRTASA